MPDDQKPTPPPAGNFIGIDMSDLNERIAQRLREMAEQLEKPAEPEAPQLRVIKGGKEQA